MPASLQRRGGNIDADIAGIFRKSKLIPVPAPEFNYRIDLIFGNEVIYYAGLESCQLSEGSVAGIASVCITRVPISGRIKLCESYTERPSGARQPLKRLTDYRHPLDSRLQIHCGFCHIAG